MDVKTNSNILIGPELQLPCRAESLGLQIYKSCLEARPEEVLFIEAVSGERTTYVEFLNVCVRLARSLRNCGYKMNDVVAICSENNRFFFIPVVASLLLGLISTPLNPTYTSREMSHLVNISQPKVIFCSEKLLDMFIEQKKESTFIERIIVLDYKHKDKEFESLEEFINKYTEKDFAVETFVPVEVNPLEQVAAIMCSSGTTGLPKGVMVTHDNISMRVNQWMDSRLSNLKHEVICAFLPFFHTFGFMTVVAGMPIRNTFVILRRFEEDLFLKTLEKYGVNTLLIVPTIGHILAKSPNVLKHDLSVIKEISCAGAPLSADVETIILSRFPLVKTVRQGYGMTETTLAVLLMPIGEGRVGSSGKIVPGMSVYVRDLETGKALGPNRSGELCFKGRLITKGYYRNSEATKGAYVNGWLHTGDIGYYDEDGYFFVVDRLKDLIKYKGFQVAPAEVEEILLTHSKIKEAGVVGFPDEAAGELPTAIVVKENGSDITEADIIQFVASTYGTSFGVTFIEAVISGQTSKPKQLHGGVYFVDALPKTASGKVLRRALKDMLVKQKS